MPGSYRAPKCKHRAGVACATHFCRLLASMLCPGECYYNTVLRCEEYFSLSSVVSHTFSVLCMYSKFRHHPHPLRYLCAKFVFIAASTAELAHGEKSCTHSITHSPSFFDAPGTEACASELSQHKFVLIYVLQHKIA